MGQTARARAEAKFAAIQKKGGSEYDGTVDAPTEITVRTARLRALRLAKEKAGAEKASADTRKPSSRLPQVLVYG